MKKFVLKSIDYWDPNSPKPMTKQAVIYEYIAYQVYALFCQTPKVYIVEMGSGHYGLASKFLPGFLTLNQFLAHDTAYDTGSSIDGRAHIYELSLDEIESIRCQKIQEIEGMLGMLAGAILLKDWDCIGQSYSNAGVMFGAQGKPIAVKIDPGRAELFEMVNGMPRPESEEDFLDFFIDNSDCDIEVEPATPYSADSFETNKSNAESKNISGSSAHLILNIFCSDYISPKIATVFGKLMSSLGREAKDQVISMLMQVSDAQLEEIVYANAITELLDGKQQALIMNTLKNRVAAIKSCYAHHTPTSTYLLHQRMSTHHPLKSLSIFIDTGETIQDGRSRPSIFIKTTKRQRFLQQYQAAMQVLKDHKINLQWFIPTPPLRLTLGYAEQSLIMLNKQTSPKNKKKARVLAQVTKQLNVDYCDFKTNEIAHELVRAEAGFGDKDLAHYIGQLTKAADGDADLQRDVEHKLSTYQRRLPQNRHLFQQFAKNYAQCHLKMMLMSRRPGPAMTLSVSSTSN